MSDNVIRGFTDEDIQMVTDPEAILGVTREEIIENKRKLREMFATRSGNMVLALLEGMINYRAGVVMSPQSGVDGVLEHLKVLGGMKSLCDFRDTLKTLMFERSDEIEEENSND